MLLLRCSSGASFAVGWRIAKISRCYFELGERKWRMESTCIVLPEFLSSVFYFPVDVGFD